MSSVEHARLRAHLKLTTNRLRLLQQKNSAIAKQNRRNIAQVLRDGKLESARIRVENVIQEDIQVELLEALEIYSELALARVSLLNGPEIPDARLKEAILVLLYYSQFSDIKELRNLKLAIAHVTSKQFVQEASENESAIPAKILSKIHLEVPKQELVDLYLLEIAKAYQIEVPGVYSPPADEAHQTQPPAEVEKSGAETSSADSENTANGSSAQPSPAAAPADDLWSRFAALKR